MMLFLSLLLGNVYLNVPLCEGCKDVRVL